MRRLGVEELVIGDGEEWRVGEEEGGLRYCLGCASCEVEGKEDDGEGKAEVKSRHHKE